MIKIIIIVGEYKIAVNKIKHIKIYNNNNDNDDDDDDDIINIINIFTTY